MSKNRAIIKINEELCNGCGVCLPSCAEGALRIENGKLRLIADKLCDGLGACLGSCPRGALSIELREAAPFEDPAHGFASPSAQPHSAPAAPESSPESSSGTSGAAATQANWPLKLALAPANAPFLRNADILLTADCAPGACASFHFHHVKSRPLLLCCPKLEDKAGIASNLAALIRKAAPASFTIMRMEVPCCGIPELLVAAQREAGSSIPVHVRVLDRFGNEAELRRSPALQSLC